MTGRKNAGIPSCATPHKNGRLKRPFFVNVKCGSVVHDAHLKITLACRAPGMTKTQARLPIFVPAAIPSSGMPFDSS